ncbi:modular serine protease [Holotrichia oblita]|uniref:Modular serine protease n=1 Tax=Holotrichia oblita TaxID=644536 RepID=A0ACB9SIN2_HOLOL|nr:modular serine protease [Holotrichia oblita]
MASRFVPLVIAYFTIVLVTEKTSAQRLESPCPRLFVYEPPGTETDRWYGIITLISDSDLNGVWLRVIFDRPSLQLGNWFGEVKTEDNKDYLIKNRNHKLTANTPFPIRFYIKYDPNNPVPRLESFRLNAKTVCPEGLATTAPPVASNQLYTNKEPDATSPLPPPQPAEPPSRPSGGNRPSFRPPESTDEDDYFQGDFSGFNLKPTGIGSNVECGTIAVQPRPLITYGQKTKAGEFPWHAALYHSRGVGLNYICGGSLISRYHVLTVAHCVSRSRSQSLLNPDNLLVYLGKYYLKKWSIRAFKIIKFLKLFAILSMTRKRTPTILQLLNCHNLLSLLIFLFFKIIGTVVGWGFDENGKLTEELTMLNMPIVSKDSCIYSFPDFFSRFTTSETYCAGFTNGTSVCNGDSGGGMVFQKPTANPNRKAYHLRGLVSVSVALQNEFKCDPTHYVVFTDVAKYLEFIKQAIRQ